VLSVTQYCSLVYRFSSGHYSHCCLNPVIFALLTLAAFLLYHDRFGVARQIALSAEPAWAPPADAKWEEKDFEGEIQKLEKEADERMDAKIAEMMSKIDNTGL
jgi:hypothetical protein